MYKYQKLRKVGEGGQGTVKLARVVVALDGGGGEGGGGGRERRRDGEGEGGEDADENEDQEDDVAADADLITSQRAKRLREERRALAAQYPVGSFVAIKKFRVLDSRKGIDHQAIRELKAMQELNHPHVIRPIDMFKHNFNMNVVMPMMEFDLDRLIQANRRGTVSIAPADVKAYMYAIVAGVEHCHARWILHRDLKPGNVLLDVHGHICIADFGMSKVYGDEYPMSPEACTMLYRAPELLMGSRDYGPPMDMWSIGCIFAELCLNRRLFDGAQCELDHLRCIFSIVGTPTDSTWPSARELEGYIEFTRIEPTPFSALFPALPSNALDLLQRLLALDPARRITAREALAHEYFAPSTFPARTPPERLPVLREAAAAAAASGGATR